MENKGNTIKGTLIEKRKLVKGQNKKGECQYQNFIVEVKEPKYTRVILFTAWNKTISYLDNKNIGDEIEVTYSIDLNSNKTHNNTVAFIIK